MTRESIGTARRRLFVYYRVARADLTAAVVAVRAMQQALCNAVPDLQVDLLRQPGSDANDHVTLMETYVLAEGIDGALHAAIDAAAQQQLARWTVGQRHIEVFEPCA